MTTGPPPQCLDGEVRLTNMYNESITPYVADYYYQERGGFLEVCYQGNWISVCLNSYSIDTINQLAELACGTIYGPYSTLIKN